MNMISKQGARRAISRAARTVHSSLTPLRAARGRLRFLSPFPCRFSGAYATYTEALAAAAGMGLAGYDHDEVAEVAFEKMCHVALWDYPVLFWLRRLSGEVGFLIDAGGHMGTKYRAFRDLLPITDDLHWVVYDLPAIVRAGRRRAEADGLTNLRFVERLEDAGATDVFLGSGLLQYLDVPLPNLLRRLPWTPRHLLLNKVALREGPTVVTLERIGKARVPYQMRNEETFLKDVQSLGYSLVDRWSIPSLSHVIDTHPELGASESAGFYFKLP
ncbi:methyltransferase, TIGR04325 family [Chelativorans salis]|nr:methyltransferase, TIGR04325 family [Chelativorans sp. EGI FJ00035]